MAKAPPELGHNETYEIGILPDESTIYVKRVFSTNGEYNIVRRMKGGTDFTDMILEDGYITISAAIERAWFFFNMLSK